MIWQLETTQVTPCTAVLCQQSWPVSLGLYSLEVACLTLGQQGPGMEPFCALGLAKSHCQEACWGLIIRKGAIEE
jgi:hypothetical protein